MSAVLTFPTRRTVGHVEADLAQFERDQDAADKLQRHQDRFNAGVHDELRACVLSSFALQDATAPIPNYKVVGFGSNAKNTETVACSADVFEEAWLHDPKFKALVLEMLADNNLASQKARLRAASFYADRNADGVAEARNWGLPS